LESWNAAGRVAALCLAVVVFAGIWESDSRQVSVDRGQVEVTLPSAPNPVWHNPESQSAIPADRQSTATQLDRILKRDCGLVRIQVHLQSVPESSPAMPAVSSEYVCEGTMEGLRTNLLTLLRQLDSQSQVVPVSAEVEDSEPEPLVAQTVVTAERGFIFLSRNPAGRPSSDSPAPAFRSGQAGSFAAGSLPAVNAQPAPRKLQSGLIHGALNLPSNLAEECSVRCMPKGKKSE